LEAIVGFFVCFEGEHVDGFHCFHPFLEQADLGLEGGEIFFGLGFGGDFGDGFGKFGALDGDLDDKLFDFGLALLLGEFLLLPLQFLELELELAQASYCQRQGCANGFVAILFVCTEFLFEND
jgi:hypothetical protein